MRSRRPSSTRTLSLPVAVTASCHSFGCLEVLFSLGVLPSPPASLAEMAKATGPSWTSHGGIASSFFRNGSRWASGAGRVEETNQTRARLPGRTATTMCSVSSRHVVGIHAVRAIVTEGLNRDRIEPPQPTVFRYFYTTPFSFFALNGRVVRVSPDSVNCRPASTAPWCRFSGRRRGLARSTAAICTSAPWRM